MGIFKDLFRMRKAGKEVQQEMTGGTGLREELHQAAGLMEQMPGLLSQVEAELPQALQNAGTTLQQTSQAADVQAQGEPATATLTAIRDTNMRMGTDLMVELDLTVTRAGQAPYPVTIRQQIPQIFLPRLVPGAQLPAKVMPLDPTKVALVTT
jgi:hypothetical protein